MLSTPLKKLDFGAEDNLRDGLIRPPFKHRPILFVPYQIGFDAMEGEDRRLEASIISRRLPGDEVILDAKLRACIYG
ncbi:hypothetical protein HCUR_00206 [Holospora curviuscula]|uniref:Uncharacterized protein n=1 Tax=Holospora curviuscula TaxID=1082868 RepID=A0A2S5RE26_9PROT|nr:hypothetical protein HCUR_00206 [Holospora curviuscula]